MDALGDHFLSGAGFAEQKYRRATVGHLADRREDIVHRRRVADDVLEAKAIADLRAKLRILLDQLFLLPHHHAVDLNRLRQICPDDIHERMVVGELLVVAVRLIDRQRPGGAAADLDRDAQKADLDFGRDGGEPAGAVQEIRVSANIANDPRPAGGDNVSGDAFTQGIAVPLDVVGGEAQCRFGAQSAGRFIQQNQRASMHI